MKLLAAFFAIVFALAMGCSDDGNTDAAEEQSCLTATGDWYIQTYSCDGVDQGLVLNTFFTFSSGAVALKDGPVACRNIVNFTSAAGTTAAELALTGSGSSTCEANGTGVPNCASGSDTCTPQNFDGFDNTYSSCVISSGTMTLSRTINVQTAGVSGCADGQAELMTLTQTPVSLPAGLLILGSDPHDFGSVAVGGSSNHTFDVLNNTAVSVSMTDGSSFPTDYSFTGGAFPGSGGTCTATLGAGNTCQIEVRFTPFSIGTHTATITIDYNDGAAKQSTQSLTGVGVVPASLSISGVNPHDFGSVQTINSANHIFTITNAGGMTATGITGTGLAAPFGFVGGTYPGTAGDCGVSLAPGANCTVDVEFATPTIGPHNDTMSIDYNDGIAAQSTTKDVTGNGIP